MRRLTTVVALATGLISVIAWAVEPAPKPTPKPVTYSTALASCDRAMDLCRSLPVVSVQQLDGCRAAIAAWSSVMTEYARNVTKMCPDADPGYRGIPTDAFDSCVNDLPTCNPQVRAMIVAEEKRRASCEALDANATLPKSQIPGPILKRAQAACNAAIRTMGG